MAKYNVRIELPGSDKTQYQQLNTALKKETTKGIKLFAVRPSGKPTQKAEYDVEGNISILDLVNVVSKASRRVSKDISFTILRNKALNN